MELQLLLQAVMASQIYLCSGFTCCFGSSVHRGSHQQTGPEQAAPDQSPLTFSRRACKHKSKHLGWSSSVCSQNGTAESVSCSPRHVQAF